MEKYVAPPPPADDGAEPAVPEGGDVDPLMLESADALKDVMAAALEISGLQEMLGVDQPTVIT